MFHCSKIGGICPHSNEIEKDENYIFVMMPFEGFDSVYDVVKQSVESACNNKFKCDRADEQYTNISIWCDRICKNIRKAKYCIIDTTGRNPNVFYELGFAHSMVDSNIIIITQNIKDAPFDIIDMGHIIYSEKKLPELRNNLKVAIENLEDKEKKRQIKIEKTYNKIVDEKTLKLAIIYEQIEGRLKDKDMISFEKLLYSLFIK